MLLIGLFLVVVGAILVVFGVVGVLAQWILVAGIVVIGVALVLIVATQLRGRSDRQL